MLRGMVFLDHMNFDIALKDYYRSLGKTAPKLDYNKLFKEVVRLRADVDFTKAYIFAPKPDEFLMKDSNLSSYYKWVTGLRAAKYTDVIEGRYIARPTGEKDDMNINDRESYYKVEKGTDLNLAIHALSKAFYDSYDIAYIMSADTDYISLYKQLKTIGKIVIVITVQNQKIGKIIPEVDDHYSLSEEQFNRCIRVEKKYIDNSSIKA